jgi:hypothetical protein
MTTVTCERPNKAGAKIRKNYHIQSNCQDFNNQLFQNINFVT